MHQECKNIAIDRLHCLCTEWDSYSLILKRFLKSTVATGLNKNYAQESVLKPILRYLKLCLEGLRNATKYLLGWRGSRLRIEPSASRTTIDSHSLLTLALRNETASLHVWTASRDIAPLALSPSVNVRQTHINVRTETVTMTTHDVIVHRFTHYVAVISGVAHCATFNTQSVSGVGFAAVFRLVTVIKERERKEREAYILYYIIFWKINVVRLATSLF
jgi:hypothetical protein